MIKVELFPGALKRSFPPHKCGRSHQEERSAGFATPGGGLVWTGISDNFNPNSAEKAINNVVKVVVKDLEKEGIF